MAYASWSVVFGEQPSAAKWNILGTNDASFNDGTGIGSAVITSAKLKYGLLRNRQGGNSGDADWASGGTTNVATNAKDVFIQTGCILISGTSGSEATITFPTTYSYTPLVLTSPASAGGQNTTALVNTTTTSTFKLRMLFSGGASTSENYNWLAVGQ